MNVSDKFRKIILEEIDYVVTKMNESETPDDKIYYFSAIDGMIQRIFNLEYDEELVYAHIILKETHNAFISRLQAIKAGQKEIPIYNVQFEKLIILAKELADKIEKKEDISNVLKELLCLSYTTTGNGYYLFQKGLLKI
jgi:hypothetical protein